MARSFGGAISSNGIAHRAGLGGIWKFGDGIGSLASGNLNIGFSFGVGKGGVGAGAGVAGSALLGAG